MTNKYFLLIYFYTTLNLLKIVKFTFLKGKPMTNFKSMILVAISTLSTSIAMADEVNGIQYNSIDIGYGTASLEGGSGAEKMVFDTFKGTGISGIYRIDNFLIGGSYTTAKSEGLTLGGTAYNIKTDLQATVFELGYRFGIADGFDIVPSVSHTSQKQTFKRSGVADLSSNSSGNTVTLSAFNKLTENLQSTVGFGRSSSENNILSAGLLYKLNKSWGVRGIYSYTTGSDNLKGTQTTISLSYLF